MSYCRLIVASKSENNVICRGTWKAFPGAATFDYTSYLAVCGNFKLAQLKHKFCKCAVLNNELTMGAMSQASQAIKGLKIDIPQAIPLEKEGGIGETLFSSCLKLCCF
ncbi:hypothetical protein AVEN_214153-1 [Araneus ventricosus]|uniref:Uncharacterized protein n=1 Tax=Araneus ventricosus TaxID=182803 RepID=A0A4Y2VG66_ARAVE|nr:hypothetical protein AVEN_214153-1 [Araneus ventricosus]